MFLKKEPFEFNGQSTTLTELSALQRIHYLDYLAGEEKALASSDEELSEQAMTTRLIGMSIRNSARLISYSLWHNDPEGPSEDELFHQVLSTWPAEAIGKAEIAVKTLSGMLAPVAEEAPSTDEDVDATALGDEPVTAEKP
ncbi:MULTISPECIES: phage tail assembly chaperone G [Klebsiella/Raoultella group]|jgi:phage minor tail protein G|uniref:Gp14 n=2 Tax=Klebsiella pneumoniae complex TaxID=3390273 RepID=A0A8B4VE38_KLEPN|nr:MULTISPECIES: phage minor tail protein G [Klebsiella/Raoultella group]MDU2381052.1 phage minor tail protein G [Enterobacter cloacae]MDU2531938.1 phage minor tail protein G [Escherichia coli]DAI84148.1 MAG TPA: tail assembly chaperone [Bacteriophage sp.]ASC12696.1 phage minor tail protein G [Klebsiella pneumoniae]EIV9269175.1 phage minor tail protein G [Klebsiella pneumoniae]